MPNINWLLPGADAVKTQTIGCERGNYGPLETHYTKNWFNEHENTVPSIIIKILVHKGIKNDTKR